MGRHKCREYKDKLRMANSAIKALTTKVAQNELEKEVVVGVEGGRESHQSNRGSEGGDMREAIAKVMQDEHLKQEMKKLLS